MPPLETLGDYVDLNLIVNPWQAMVATVLIFALLIWPSMSARQTSKKIEKTLTQNNGGSSVKDALDEIKRTQAEHGKKLAEHIDWSEGYVAEMGERVGRLEEAKPKRRLFGR